MFDCQHYKADRESEKERSEREGATLIIMLCKYTTDCAHYEAVRVCVCGAWSKKVRDAHVN